MKKRYLSGLVLLIALVVFNLLAFAIPHESSAAYWMGYGFTTLAFLLQILFALIAFGQATLLKKAFLGLPIALVGGAYLLVQLGWGFLCMFLPVIGTRPALIVSSLILATYLMVVIVAIIGKGTIEKRDAQVKMKTFFIKSLVVDLEILLACAETERMKQTLAQLLETAQYSDPMSNEALQNVEGRISDRFSELEGAVGRNDNDAVEAICKSIGVLFTERNKKIQLLK